MAGRGHNPGVRRCAIRLSWTHFPRGRRISFVGSLNTKDIGASAPIGGACRKACLRFLPGEAGDPCRRKNRAAAAGGIVRNMKRSGWPRPSDDRRDVPHARVLICGSLYLRRSDFAGKRIALF